MNRCSMNMVDFVSQVWCNPSPFNIGLGPLSSVPSPPSAIHHNSLETFMKKEYL